MMTITMSDLIKITISPITLSQIYDSENKILYKYFLLVC